MSKKTSHDFGQSATVAEFREFVSGEWLDAPRVPRGTRVYVRKQDEGCWHVARIVVEESGVYIEAGEESNPQDVDLIENVDPERIGDEVK